jgi:hypothetical protein
MLNKPLGPVDIIAILMIIGSFVLIACGRDSTVAAVLLSISAFYFGLNTPAPKV